MAGMLALAAGGVALLGWGLMLLVGALHAETGWPPWTLSYWVCVGIVAGIMVFASAIRGEPIVSVKMDRRRY